MLHGGVACIASPAQPAAPSLTCQLTLYCASPLCYFYVAAADTVLMLTPDLDPKLLGWGPASGQAGRALRGKATVLYRSLRRAAVDALADMAQNG